MLNKILKSVAFWMSVPTGLLGLLAGHMGGASLFEFRLLFFGGCFVGLSGWAFLREGERLREKEEGQWHPFAIGIGVSIFQMTITPVMIWMEMPEVGALIAYSALVGLLLILIFRSIRFEWQAYREGEAT
jgi:hypothetical protein